MRPRSTRARILTKSKSFYTRKGGGRGRGRGRVLAAAVMIYLPHAVPKRKRERGKREAKRNATKWSHQKRLTSLRKNGNDNDHHDDDDDDVADNDDGKWNAAPCGMRFWFVSKDEEQQQRRQRIQGAIKTRVKLKRRKIAMPTELANCWATSYSTGYSWCEWVQGGRGETEMGAVLKAVNYLMTVLP